MAKRCEVCGKGPVVGRQHSHDAGRRASTDQRRSERDCSAGIAANGFGKYQLADPDGTWIDVTKWLTAAYLISRGIAKASRVLEQ